MGWKGLARIDVEKSASHHLSQNGMHGDICFAKFWGTSSGSQPGAIKITLRVKVPVGVIPKTIVVDAMTALVSWRSSPAMSSTLAQGNHRVHFRRAACWEITSQRGHCK